MKTLDPDRRTDSSDEERFVADPAQAQYTLAYRVYAYNEGKFHWKLQVLDRSGTVVDEVQGPPSGYGYGFAGEYNFFIAVAGQHTLTYLRSRYGG